MKINADRFRVARGSRVDLAQWPTLAAPLYESAGHYAQLLQEYVTTIRMPGNQLQSSERA